MLEGSSCAVLVDDSEVAHGVVSAYAGQSLDVQLDGGMDRVPAPGERIILRTFEETHGRRDYAVVVQSRTDSTLVLDEPTLQTVHQERAIVRVPMNVPVALVPSDVDTHVQATVIDLSATGVRLHCNVPLTEGQLVGFELRTAFGDLALVAKVLRREDAPTGGYWYGCRLIGTSEQDFAALHRFVLTEQITQRLNDDK